MTTIPIRSQSKQSESWSFVYSAYASMLAVVPLILHFIDIGWAYKIAIFYLAFLGISYGSLLSSRGRRLLLSIRHTFGKLQTQRY